jgi:hypothetical protein
MKEDEAGEVPQHGRHERFSGRRENALGAAQALGSALDLDVLGRGRRYCRHALAAFRARQGAGSRIHCAPWIARR